MSKLILSSVRGNGECTTVDKGIIQIGYMWIWVTCGSIDFLRNEFNIFSVDRGINQKRTENCTKARSALLQKFSVLFSVDTSSNRKNIRFISYDLIFIASQDR